MPEQLSEYVRKRNFDQTPEPGPVSFAEPQDRLRFVIQKHDATNLHYDFRLECDGVLLSWAVPKGPSLNPQDKRMAVHVEDHPIAYGDFEGTIPEGNYGAGTVIIWDNGDIYPELEDGTLVADRDEANRELRKQLNAGKISIVLKGKKLKGSFALVKTKQGWLLIKHHDEFASTFDILTLETSVKNRNESGRFIPPMLLKEGKVDAKGEGWHHEVKLDGIRIIAVRNFDKVQLFTRNGIDVSIPFGHITERLSRLNVETCVLDGEIVYYDQDGKPSFQKLMEIARRPQPARHAYANLELCVFDILQLNHEDLVRQPLQERLAKLEHMDVHKFPVRMLDALGDDRALAYKIATQLGFEGIVCKRLNSRYEPGTRSDQWLKIKAYESDEFCIVGFSAGNNTRSDRFGALQLAEKTEGGWRYVGGVGSGFDEQTITQIYEDLVPEITDQPCGLFEVEKAKKVTWVNPKQWVEVRYQGRLESGHLRIPIFLRRRPDMSLEEVDTGLESILRHQLEDPRPDKVLQAPNFELHVTKQDKVNWPGAKPRTKRDYLLYLLRMWETMAPHLRDRPLTLIRWPNGIAEEGVYQKHWQHAPPSYVVQKPIWSGTHGKPTEFTLCNNLNSLLWLGQMGILELHGWYSSFRQDVALPMDTSTSEETLQASVLGHPEFIVFDLDPPQKDRSGFDMCKEAALALNETLSALGLTAFVKTSGKNGLHVYVPIKRNLPYRATHAFAQQIGVHMTQTHPALFTIEWSRDKRPNKVYFDYNQNGMGRTLPVPYSARAVPGAPVSMPLEWEEVAKIQPEDFDIISVPELMQTRPDAWRTILQNPQDLTALLGGQR